MNWGEYKITPRLAKIKDGYTNFGSFLDHGFIKNINVANFRNGDVEYSFIHKNQIILHREDGPARINVDKNISHFFFNGFRICDVQQYCFLCGMDDIETMMMILKYG